MKLSTIELLHYHSYTSEKRAKQLLLKGKMSLAEIAIAYGFPHQSHPARPFKHLTGCALKIWLKS